MEGIQLRWLTDKRVSVRNPVQLPFPNKVIISPIRIMTSDSWSETRQANLVEWYSEHLISNQPSSETWCYDRTVLGAHQRFSMCNYWKMIFSQIFTPQLSKSKMSVCLPSSWTIGPIYTTKALGEPTLWNCSTFWEKEVTNFISQNIKRRPVGHLVEQSVTKCNMHN